MNEPQTIQAVIAEMRADQSVYWKISQWADTLAALAHQQEQEDLSRMDTMGDSIDSRAAPTTELPSTLKALARGIRMLGVMPHEHPQSGTYTEALDMAARYVECFIGREWNLTGDGNQPPSRDAVDPVAARTTDGSTRVAASSSSFAGAGAQETAQSLEWLARLAKNARTVQCEEVSEHNPTGDPWPLATAAERCAAVIAHLEADVARLTEINAELCHAHNALLIDGARWQTRAEAAEAALATMQERAERAEADREGYLLALHDLQSPAAGEAGTDDGPSFIRDGEP